MAQSLNEKAGTSIPADTPVEATVGLEPTTYCLGVHLEHDFENRSTKAKLHLSAWLCGIMTSSLFSLVSHTFCHLRKQNGNGIFTAYTGPRRRGIIRSSRAPGSTIRSTGSNSKQLEGGRIGWRIGMLAAASIARRWFPG